MKNLSRTIIGGCIAALTLFTVSSPVLADEVDSKTTTATITFTAGKLEIVEAPEFDFGSQEISSRAAVCPAQAGNGPLTLGVSDARGAGDGWKVNVRLSAFALDRGAATLNGASLKLAYPAGSAAGGTVGTPPAIQQSVTIPSDNSVVPVVTANEGEGAGAWTITWDNANVKLNVPGGSAETGVSTGTLNWILQDAP